MFTRKFWREAIERAVKSGAQAFLLVCGAARVDWITFDWGMAGWAFLGGAVLSVATSLVSEPFGPSSSPSAV